MRSHRCKKSPEKIKTAIDPCSFYLVEQGLDRIKSNEKKWVVAGCCPFHQDSSPGSFYIQLESGAYNCFSCGAKGGDSISFLQKKYEIPFFAALEKLTIEWRVR